MNETRAKLEKYGEIDYFPGYFNHFFHSSHIIIDIMQYRFRQRPKKKARGVISLLDSLDVGDVPSFPGSQS